MWVLSEVMEVRAVTSNQSLPDFPVLRELTGNFTISEGRFCGVILAKPAE